MYVLIVEENAQVADVWKRHLERTGHRVVVACDQPSAISRIQQMPPDIIVLDLVLTEGSALAVSDYASYRAPDARVIFVTDTTFFSDGSIFAYAQNACAFVQTATPPEDIAALIDHYSAAS